MSVRWRFLLIPLLLNAATVFTQDSVHTIQRGETIYSIARSYGVRVDDLLGLNKISDARTVQAGQRIKIPGTAQVPPANAVRYTEYRVVRGDTLYGLARRFGTTMQDLRTVNGLREDYVLKLGDLLKVPQEAAAGNTASPPAPAKPVTRSGTADGAASGTPNGGAKAPAAGTADNGPAAAVNAPAGGGTNGTAASSGSRVSGGAAGTGALTTTLSGASPVWPVRAKEVMYMTGKLQGVVLLGERSETVKSLTQGTVVSAGPYRGFGKVAIVQMAGGYLYVYGGCESLSVKEGDRVTPGSELGRLGIDGVSSKPQLFFLVYQSNTPIDPAKAPRA
jgi:murein DD-endopeptidase MepM/ murein hydrolase activator NlpD